MTGRPLLRRTGRRRKLASAIRLLMAGRRLPPGPGDDSDAVGRRLLELAGEQKIAPRDSDQAELLARLRLDDRVPADAVAAICAALLPILMHSEIAAAEGSEG